MLLDMSASARRFLVRTEVSSAKAEPLRMALEPLGVTIDFHGAADAAHGFHSVLRGWSHGPAALSGDDRPADLRIVRSGGMHRWHGTTLTKPLIWQQRAPTTSMGVICDLHDVLFDWFLDKHPDHLCLHAAAIETGQGLVLIPSVGKAGKSTLSVAMAELEHRVFADDVLALEPERDHGMAFGVVPRLRMPLPENAGVRYRRFLDRRSGPSNDHWLYADLGEDEIAPFGETAPIKAIVFLDRRAEGPARFEPVDSAHVLRELIRQNFAQGVAPVPAFDRLLALAQRAHCRRLVFSDTNAAARLLSRDFASKATRRLPSTASGLRSAGVERSFGDALFLVSQRQNAVLGLSPTAAAIWRQIAQGRSRRTVEALFQSAFPEIETERIGADLESAVRMFERHGLVKRNGKAIAKAVRR